MPRTPTVTHGERFKVGRHFRQQCCDCGLCHDWKFILKNGQLWVEIRVNSRATAAARRAKQVKK